MHTEKREKALIKREAHKVEKRPGHEGSPGHCRDGEKAEREQEKGEVLSLRLVASLTPLCSVPWQCVGFLTVPV